MLCLKNIFIRFICITFTGIVLHNIVVAQTYTFVKNDPVVSFRDILFNPELNKNTTELTPSVDGEVSIVLPFRFSLFCTSNDTISISEDGALALGNRNTIPNDNNGTGLINQQYLIAPWWDSWQRTGSARILYSIIGTAPNRILVVQWNNMQISGLTSGVNATFQAQLFEGSNAIAFVYQSTNLGDDAKYAYAKDGAIGIKGMCTGGFAPNDVVVIEHSKPALPEKGSNLSDSLSAGVGNFVFIPQGACTIGAATPPTAKAIFETHRNSPSSLCRIDASGARQSFTIRPSSSAFRDSVVFSGTQQVCGQSLPSTVQQVYMPSELSDCKMFFVKFQITASVGACSDDSLTIICDNFDLNKNKKLINIGVNGQGKRQYTYEFSGFLNDVDGNSYELAVFTVQDMCGYVAATQTFQAYRFDNTPPTIAVKTDWSTPLNAANQATLTVADLALSSSDNCTTVRQYIRRLDGKTCSTPSVTGACSNLIDAADGTCYRDNIILGCCDVGNTTLVEIISLDAQGNYKRDTVKVKVINQAAPTCTAPPSVATTCIDIDKKIGNPTAYNFGTATASGSCGFTLVESAVSSNLAACYPVGQNYFTRTWQVKDCKNQILNTCTQRITVIADTARPQAVALKDTTLCTTNRCATVFSTTLSATNTSCGKSSEEGLTFVWAIFRGTLTNNLISGPLVVSGESAKVETILDTGQYIIQWSVQNTCGLSSPVMNSRIRVNDCQSPSISTQNPTVNLVAIGVQSGQATGTVAIGSILRGVSDNCTDSSFLLARLAIEKLSDRPTATTYPPQVRTSLLFNCDDIKKRADSTDDVRIWAIDRAGNVQFAISTVKLTDISGACRANIFAPLRGKIQTESGKGVDKVFVSTSTNSPTQFTTITNTNGDYAMANLLIDGNYTFQATKTSGEDRYSGITTTDISIISEHLLGEKKISTPYSLIAADVDKSGEIDGADILHLRALILRRSESLPGGIWRFIDKKYEFKNPLNPFTEDFPEIIQTKIQPLSNSANFIGVKLGDVNQSVEPRSESSSRSESVVLKTDNIEIKKGDTYNIEITAQCASATSIQGTLSFNKAKVKSITSTDLTDDNFALFDDAVTMSWNLSPSVKKTIQRFTLSFEAQTSGQLSDIITWGSIKTPSAATDRFGTALDIQLLFNQPKKELMDNFVLHQNVPNPTRDETTIGFNLPQPMTAQITLFDVSSKVYEVVKGSFQAGYNAIQLNVKALPRGVYFYRLDTPNFLATKKLVLVD